MDNLYETTKKPSNCNGLSDSPSDSPPGLELKIEKKKIKVAIVGAGISGLRAASVLERHGVEVVVLEGRDRIGGRIHTTRTKDGIPRDIGAAWLHETSQNRLTKLIASLKLDYYYDDGAPLYYTQDGRAGAQFKAKKVADEAVCNAEWYYETFPDAPDTSVTQYVNAFVQKHELISESDRSWAPMAIKEVELWIGTSCDLASAKHLSYFISERNLYMKGGYDNIVKWTAQSLRPDTIHLNKIVDRISWSYDGVQSCTLDYHDPSGEVANLEADAVISTLPLGVLRHGLVAFNPPLPTDMQIGISRFGYGALGKIFFEFDDVFWSKDNDQFVFYPSPPDLEEDIYSTSASSGSSGSIEVDSILNYATVIINLWIVTGSKELCVQVAEPLTQRIEAMTDKKAVYKFFEPLFRLLRTEPYKALPRLLNVETTKWTQDPLAGFGSYSADKVDDEPELWMASLEKHKDSRLQFAGEHCTMVANGCVHGAFATGETAAKNILKIFDIEYDGGDMVSIN